VTRNSSALSIGFRPVRQLFEERAEGPLTVFTCRLCRWTFRGTPVSWSGWPCSVEDLYYLVSHLKDHAT
jgi:hypothetical protein